MLLLELFTLQKSLPPFTQYQNCHSCPGWWLSWLECQPMHQRLQIQFLVRYMPRLRVRSLVVVCTGGTQLMFFTLMFLPLPLSLKIYNKSSSEDLKNNILMDLFVFKDTGVSYLVFIWIVHSLQKSFTYISLFPHYNKP